MQRLLAAAALAALFAGSALAQANLATVTGIVTDDTGAVIPGASVKITNTGTNRVRQVSTGPKGGYTFTNLSPGNFELVATS